MGSEKLTDLGDSGGHHLREQAKARLHKALSNRAIGRGLRIAIVLPAVMGFLFVTGYRQASFLAAFAVIMILMTADYSGPRRERAMSNLVTVAIGAVTFLLGATLNPIPLAVIAAAMVLGVSVTLVSALRGFLSKATVPFLLPFFLGATSTSVPQYTLEMMGGWVFGGLVALVASLVMWPYFPRAKLLASITTTLRDEAQLAERLWNDDGSDPIDALNKVEESYAQVQANFEGNLKRPGSTYRRERRLNRLVEETRRLRVTLRVSFRRWPFEASVADRMVIGSAAAALRESADAADAGTINRAVFEEQIETRARHRDWTLHEVQRRLAAGDAAGVIRTASSAFRARAVSLAASGPIRDAAMLADPKPAPEISTQGVVVPTNVGLVLPWHRLRAELSLHSPWLRNALRVGIALSIALVVVQFTGVDRGYWVVLGTLSVLRLDLTGTYRNAWNIIKGQLLGFAIGSVLLFVVMDRPTIAWMLLPLIAGAQGYMTNNVNIVFQQAGFTLLLVTMTAISASQRNITVLRIEDVGLGVLVAITVSLLVFPRGVVPRVQRHMMLGIRSAADYFAAAVTLRFTYRHGEQVQLSSLETDSLDEVERARETVDLALAQGVAQSAQTTLWLRLLMAQEYVEYMAGITAALTKWQAETDAINHEVPQRLAATLAAATTETTNRLVTTSQALLDLSEHLADLDELPEYVPTGDYSANVAAAIAAVDRYAEKCAAAKDQQSASVLLLLYWTLGWVGEVDIMTNNNRLLIAALRADLGHATTR